MTVSNEKNIPGADLVALFEALDWSSARFPEKLEAAVASSHRVVSLWDGDRLAGLVTAISDGAMCVYFPYVAIHPEYQGQGWGRALMEDALAAYRGFHHAALICYEDKQGFYEKQGFAADGGKKALFLAKNP